MAHLKLRSPERDLIPLLRHASSDDLQILVEYILKAELTSELQAVPDFKRLNPRASEKKYDGDHRVYAEDIAAEIQMFGGNTIANIFRGGEGVLYREVVRDVADKFKVSYNDSTPVSVIETQLQLKVLEKAYEGMNEAERKELLDTLGVKYSDGIPKVIPLVAIQAAINLGGFVAYQLAMIVANAIAKQVLGHGLQLAMNAGIARGLGVLAGPIGWAISAIWALYDISGPAYRVTIPCVLQVAYIRQKSLINACHNCGTHNATSAKFCQDCGASLQMPPLLNTQ